MVKLTMMILVMVIAIVIMTTKRVQSGYAARPVSNLYHDRSNVT